jgi:hypothetical protein
LDIRAWKKIVAKLQCSGDSVTVGEHRVASLGKSDDVEQGLLDVEIAAIRTGAAGVRARLISVRYDLLFATASRIGPSHGRQSRKQSGLIGRLAVREKPASKKRSA